MNEVRKYLQKHPTFFSKESPRHTRTRSEGEFQINLAFDWIQNYIDKLWLGIEERLTHFDSDGTTSWSEAPAEGFFSILQTIVDHKTAIKLSNLTKLCRIVKEGPKPGTNKASEIRNKSMSEWPSRYGLKFATNSFMKRTTSATVSKILNNK